MNFLKKWYTYQKERFPILTFALYVFCIVFATFCFCHYFGKINYEILLKTVVFFREPDPYSIDYLTMIPMFIVAFLQFLMVRIADEFKDYEEDCKYRPYRPVPRGLITLKELKVLFIICAIIQLIITLIYSRDSVILLLFVWEYFAIMSKDFFLKKFLDKHLLINVTFDEILLPILVLYLSSYVYIDGNIWLLLLMSYIISWIVEVARKIRCKQEEEEGVKTYTAVFGIGGAIFILFILETILMLLQIMILGKKYLIIIIGVYILVNIINLLFINKKNKKSAKITELSANIYIIVAYLSLGLLIL